MTNCRYSTPNELQTNSKLALMRAVCKTNPSCANSAARSPAVPSNHLPLFLLFRFFEHALFGDDDDDAAFGDVIFLAVLFEVIADFGMFRDMNMAVDDGAPDA